MKVIFLQHVVNVGKIGDIKEVSDSYARNVLLPKKMVKEFTKEEQIRLENKKKKEEQNRITKVEHRHELWETLNGKKFEFHLNTDVNGKSFGSIGEKEIIDELKKELKLNFTKGEIVMNNGHLKKAGIYDVFVKLGAGEMAKIIVTII
nr:50S ribosomal protein L9 [Candidatus Gracilibacteria bacterium]